MKRVLLLSFFVALSANAGPEGHHEVKVNPQFENLKALVGTWEGTTTMEGKTETTTIKYELTSGGTAIVETMAPGTKHEMVTVYANRGNTVNATHFCMAGNQPEMKLKKSATNSFTFEMDGVKGISNKNEMHMHGVTLTLNGNKLKQEWTNFKNNKKADTTVFELTKI